MKVLGTAFAILVALLLLVAIVAAAGFEVLLARPAGRPAALAASGSLLAGGFALGAEVRWWRARRNGRG